MGSIAAIMRSLSSRLDATRSWRRAERARSEKRPSTMLSQDLCLGMDVPRRQAEAKTGTR